MIRNYIQNEIIPIQIKMRQIKYSEMEIKLIKKKTNITQHVQT